MMVEDYKDKENIFYASVAYTLELEKDMNE